MYKKFWFDANRVKRTYIQLWLGWIPIGMVAYYLLYLVFQSEPRYSMFIVLIAWGYFWRKQGVKFKGLKCPKCDSLLFENSTIMFTKLKCKSCGLTDEHT